jgi:hypothetical protein
LNGFGVVLIRHDSRVPIAKRAARDNGRASRSSVVPGRRFRLCVQVILLLLPELVSGGRTRYPRSFGCSDQVTGRSVFLTQSALQPWMKLVSDR